MKKQISIALAAGLLMAVASAASATEIRHQVSGGNTPQKNKHSQNNIYAGHSNSKGQQHAAFTVSRDHQWHNVDID